MADNVAIVITVSEYEALENLAACANDFRLISRSLQKIGKYDDILMLNENIHSANAKQELAQRISAWSARDIGEVFFYYSGHGIVHDNQLIFPFTNYHSSSALQTSLPNGELDEMLRSLSPQIAMKVVDACHSGAEYIKSDSSLQDAMNRSKPAFSRLYFLCSSLRGQKSYTGSIFSRFTQSFAKAICEHQGATIRYRDIINYISDDSKRYPLPQDPFFVVQASATEVFCGVNSDLVNAIREELLAGSPAQDLDKDRREDSEEPPDTCPADAVAEGLPVPDNLLKIQAISDECCDKEEAISALRHMSSLVRQYRFSGIINSCYDIEYQSLSDLPALPSIRQVAEWIKERGGDFFAKVNYSEEEYEAYEQVEYIDEPSDFMRKISPFSSMLSAKTKRIKKEPVIKTRPSPSGYSISAHMPFACLSVSLIPKYRALPHQDLHILPIVSLRRLRVFYKQDKQIMLDFDQVTPGDANDWLSEECRLASDEAIGYLIGKAMKHLDDQVNVEISRLAE